MRILFTSALLVAGCGEPTIAPTAPPRAPVRKAEPPDYDLDRAEAGRDPSYVGRTEPEVDQRVEFTTTTGFVGFHFQGYRGQRVSLALRGAADAFLFLYGPRRGAGYGQPLARNDDANGLDALIARTLPETGDYVVVATTWQNAMTRGARDTAGLELVTDLGWDLAPELGSGSRAPGSVTITTVATLPGRPTGVAFHPNAPAQAWVVSQGDNALTVLDTTTTPARIVATFLDPASHVLASPTSLAFSPDERTFVSCQESTGGSREEFMGPAVWPSNLAELVADDLARWRADRVVVSRRRLRPVQGQAAAGPGDHGLAGLAHPRG